jgi:hypothetical protein
MRVGWNPQKSEKKIELKTHHRVVLVVFIPNEEGFYKDSINVFKLSLDSIISSVNSNCAITVVNNGSYSKVTELLNSYFSEKKIDSVIHHNKNIGKIDALIGAAKGAREKLITYTDSDILFENGWQQNVEKIFIEFPNVGSVSPIPVRKGIFYATSSVLKQVLIGNLKIKFEPIPENFDSYNKYLSSINWNKETSEAQLWPIISSRTCKAIIGSGHQVLTIDSDILNQYIPKKPSLILVGGDSEYKYVDEPIDFSGKLRLSTYNNYAYHMGNTTESWMYSVLDTNEKEKKMVDIDLFKLKSETKTNFSFKLKCYRYKKNLIKLVFKFFYKNSLNY